MNYLLKPISANLFRQKSTLLLLAIALFPLLIIVTSFVNTNFMQLDGANASISALDFVSAIISTQHQFIFPFIILAYIAANLFYDEIKSGRLMIFKDTSRSKLLNAKRLSIFLVFIAYFLLISVMCLVTYYVYIQSLPIATKTFFPKDGTQQVIVEIFGFFLTELMGLSIALTVSIFLTSGYTILVTIFFQLITMLAPNLSSLRYVFPTGYKTLVDSISFPVIIIVMLAISAIFMLVSKAVALGIFKRIEY